MRIFLLGNSQATALGVPRDRSYPALLRRKVLPQHEWHVMAMNGWSVRDFDFHLDNVLVVEPDVVVLQIGIVEASRRILSEREKRLLYRFPGTRRLTKFLHDHRKRVVLLRNRFGLDTRLYTPDEFDRRVGVLVERIVSSGAKPVIVETPRFGLAYEAEHFPLINDDVEVFNSVLRRHEAVPFFDLADDLDAIWQAGTVHFNQSGHELAARRIGERVAAVLTS
jgi:GDSL-like Lipase/Acylhydrolase family